MKPSDKKIQNKSVTTTHKFENIIQVVEPLAPDIIAKKLTSFSVTTDSVVATAIVVVDDSHRHLSLHWGDDLVEVIDLYRLRIQSGNPGDSQEPNTLKFQHIYRAPFDYGRKIIVAITLDTQGKKSFETAVVEVEQRFKFSFYSIILDFPEHLDSTFETDSELDVRMNAFQDHTIFFANNWKADITTAPQITTGEPIQWRLAQSSFSREISYSDEPIGVFLEIFEEDGLGEEGGVLNFFWDVVTLPFRAFQNFPFTGDFDTDSREDQTGYPLYFHPRIAHSTPLTARYDMTDNEGKVIATFHYDLTLIVPIDRSLEKKMMVSA